MTMPTKPLKTKDYAQAAYYYWEINFAYEDEEFPFSYTPEIGRKAYAGFKRTMQRISVDDILASEFYRTLKEFYNNSQYTRKYLCAFEKYIAKYASSHSKLKSHQ